jgi:peptidoglycan/xylan/chitin deacetylase (PgdA/CDA1 family)
MKELLKKALIGSGLLRFGAGVTGRGAAILMYHSVRDDPAEAADSLGGIVHSTSVFRKQMELLARQFHPVSLERIAGFVKGPGDLPARAVAVTFDDGYADNFDFAAPILNQLGIPATFYATAGCIAQGELPWPARLRFAFRTTRRDFWQDGTGRAFLLKSEDDRERAFERAIEQCCRLSGALQRELVASVERQLLAAGGPAGGVAMMTPEQLRELCSQGHVIGSHTMTHPNVAQLELPEMRYELGESKRVLESMLGVEVKHFAYPCPSGLPHWNDTTAAECAAVGYETSVTTAGGLAQKGDNSQMLKRVLPSKTVDGLRWNLECAFAGRGV